MSPSKGSGATTHRAGPAWERPLLGVLVACAAAGASLASDPVVAVLSRPAASQIGRSVRVAPDATWLVLACALGCWAQAGSRPGVVSGLVCVAVGVLASFLAWAGDIELADGQLLLLAGVAALWLWFERAHVAAGDSPNIREVEPVPAPNRAWFRRSLALAGATAAFALGWGVQSGSQLAQLGAGLACLVFLTAVIWPHARSGDRAGLWPRPGAGPIESMWVPLLAAVWIGVGVGFPSMVYVALAALLVGADQLGLAGGLSTSGPGWSSAATDFLLQDRYRGGLEALWRPGVALIVLGGLLALASLVRGRAWPWIWRGAALVGVVVWARAALGTF